MLNCAAALVKHVLKNVRGGLAFDMGRVKQMRWLPLVGLCVLLSALGCSVVDQPGDPLKKADFLTPVADAKNVNLVPYWVGPAFQARGADFRLVGEAGFLTSHQGGPGILLSYAVGLGAGGILSIQTLSPSATLDDVIRQQASLSANDHFETVTVGVQQGQLISSTAGNRPVNQFLMLLEVDGYTVVATTDAADSGIPGQDANRLLDRDTLIAVLSQLRRYPE